MIGLYPFMLYPGVVLAHPELPDDQWSLLTPEGVFNHMPEGTRPGLVGEKTLSRSEYTAMWRNLPGGGVGYEARSASGQGPIRYGISLVPGDDCVDLELTVTNCQDRAWEEVMVDLCLMNIRAPRFYDADYRRTYVIGPAGLTPVADFMASPKRPVFRRAGRTKGSLHFFWPENSKFWNMTDVELSGNLVLTQSVDGEWTAAFGWEDLYAVTCNQDLAHGCVHADPHVGDIAPGQAGQVKGKIYIARGRPKEIIERFGAETGVRHPEVK